MPTSSELLASVEHLYSIFSAYPRAEKMEYCRCGCTRAEAVDALYSKPLRDLGSDNLNTYLWSALTTMGDIADFRHFLPRILELFATIPNPLLHIINPEILFSKLRYGNWHKWPELEQQAIRNYFHRLWNDLLSNPSRCEDNSFDTESCLCSIAQAEDNLIPYLNQWTENQTLEASLALTGLLLQSAVAVARDTGRNAFWSDRDEQYQQLKRWAHSEAVTHKLDNALAQWSNSEYADELHAARSILTSNSINFSHP